MEIGPKTIIADAAEKKSAEFSLKKKWWSDQWEGCKEESKAVNQMISATRVMVCKTNHAVDTAIIGFWFSFLLPRVDLDKMVMLKRLNTMAKPTLSSSLLAVVEREVGDNEGDRDAETNVESQVSFGKEG